MTENKIFNSDKDLSRFEFIRRSLLLFILLIASHFFLSLKYAQRTDSPSPTLQLTVELIMGILLIIWTLTAKITKQILLDFDKKKIIISFMTLLQNDKTIEIDFDTLNFTFDKTPSRYNAKKWTLKIFERKQKRFSIGTGDDGFSQETLEELVSQLKNISST